MASLDLIDGWGAPDAAVGVMADGRGVVAQRGDAQRRSRWASVTKPVTALAVLVGVEEGLLDLDEAAGPPGATVRHLLAHASGLGFTGRRTLAAPGRLRIYSNAGFEVLETLVAARTAQPFSHHITRTVLDPLGLASTRLEGSAAAGLVGPLDDLLLVAAELLQPTLVSAGTFAVATSVAFPGLAGVLPGFGRHDPMDWGLGFDLRDAKRPHWTGHRNSPATFGHFGASGAFLWVDPVAGLACASLSGRAFGSWAIAAWPTLADAVVDDFAPTGP